MISNFLKFLKKISNYLKFLKKTEFYQNNSKKISKKHQKSLPGPSKQEHSGALEELQLSRSLLPLLGCRRGSGHTPDGFRPGRFRQPFGCTHQDSAATQSVLLCLRTSQSAMPTPRKGSAKAKAKPATNATPTKATAKNE